MQAAKRAGPSKATFEQSIAVFDDNVEEGLSLFQQFLLAALAASLVASLGANSKVLKNGGKVRQAREIC